MRKRSRIFKVLVCMAFLSLVITPLFSKDIEFQYIELEQVSRYSEDRIAFQHIEKDFSADFDNSIATLLIIKDKKMYLIKDGYDNPKEVRTQKLLYDTESRMGGDLWANKINMKPDYIRITERRVELLKNFNEDFVSKNFGSFYTSIRDSFLQKHVNVFKQLMLNRKESGLIVERMPIPKPTYIGSEDVPVKYSITVSGKTIDEKLYYAADMDGDGITETFYVTIPDGFNWGYKSGPNIVFIYDNKQEDIKKMIGTLAKDAYYGTADEEKVILTTFPKDEDIIREFNLEKVEASVENK